MNTKIKMYFASRWLKLFRVFVYGTVFGFIIHDPFIKAIGKKVFLALTTGPGAIVVVVALVVTVIIALSYAVSGNNPNYQQHNNQRPDFQQR